MTIRVFQIEKKNKNPNQFEIDQVKKEIILLDFCKKPDDRQQQQQQQQQQQKSPIAFSENHNFKIKSDRTQTVALSENDYQKIYSITKLQSDNIFYSSKNYLIKKYKPNKICNYIINN
jgi:hypothetical protein